MSDREIRSSWSGFGTNFLLAILVTIGTIAIMGVVSIIIGFIKNVPNTNTYNLLLAIIGVIVEALLFGFSYYKICYNNKNAKLLDIFVPFIVTFIIRLIISFIINFFPIVCGFGIAYWGEFSYNLSIGDGIPVEHALIPKIFFIVPCLVQLSANCALIFMGFLFASKKHKKERQDLLNERRKSKEDIPK